MMTLPSLATYTSLSRSKLLFATLPTTVITYRIPTLPVVALPQATISAQLLKLRLAATVAHNARALVRFLCVGMPMRRMITSSVPPKRLSLAAPSKVSCRAFISGPAFRTVSGSVSLFGLDSKHVDNTQLFVEVIAAPVSEKRLNPSAPTFSPRLLAAAPTLSASAPEFTPKALKSPLNVNAPAFTPIKPTLTGARSLNVAASEFVPASCIPKPSRSLSAEAAAFVPSSCIPSIPRTLSADAPAFVPTMRKTSDTLTLNVSALEFVPHSKST